MSWTTIIMWVVGAIGGGITLKWGFYQLGKKTQKGIDQNASFEKHKKAEEIAARPVNSVDDIIERL